MPSRDALSPAEIAHALEALAVWRGEPEADLACPRCGKPELTITDRSARPYSEWFALTCPACGLDATLHIPLAPPSY